jgi:ketosteroid isomerase-like protein
VSNTAEIIRRYIDLTNAPGSPSYPLFADQLEWLEAHSGRNGGQAELFAAMNESRAAFDEMKVELKSLIVDGESAALEAQWSGRMMATGTTLSVPMVYIFGVRDGRIVKEIDYVVMPA